MKKKILVTGTNGAFGSQTVYELLRNNHTVVATMRDPRGRNSAAAAELSKAGATVIDIDVTNNQSVAEGVATAIDAMNGIDALLNVAGTGTHGLMEGYTPEQLLQLFDINVIGVHRMIRAVSPSLRAQGKGLIVNVSSLLGRITMPFYGPYTATKYAVEALSETYRVELSQFGVDVVLVEPGGFKTSWIGNLVQPEDRGSIENYGQFGELPTQALAQYKQFLESKPEQDANKVTEAIMNLVEASPGTRPARTVVDFVGLGQQVTRMNTQLEEITASVYQAFGVEGLLTLKS